MLFWGVRHGSRPVGCTYAPCITQAWRRSKHRGCTCLPIWLILRPPGAFPSSSPSRMHQCATRSAAALGHWLRAPQVSFRSELAAALCTKTDALAALEEVG